MQGLFLCQGLIINLQFLSFLTDFYLSRFHFCYTVGIQRGP